MKKLKATNPLVLLVGALAIGLVGCADDVIITEPPPPPPPPPPEAAEISIVSFVDPNDESELGRSDDGIPVSGRFGIVVNFDTGGFEAAALDIGLAGSGGNFDVACQTFSGQNAVGFSADVQTVQCIVNSAEGVGACVGNTLRGRFPNGTYIASATLTLQDGSSVTATREDQPLLFANSNGIIVVPIDVGPRVVSIEQLETTFPEKETDFFDFDQEDFPQAGDQEGSDGVAFWGGPQDLSWYACPVLFSDSLDDICEIEISAEGSGGDNTINASNGDLDLGAGFGERASSTEPFMYVATLEDNEDAVEDEALDSPHVIGNGDNGWRVFACDGTDITSSLGIISDVRHIDMTAPICWFTADDGAGDGPTGLANSDDAGDLARCAPRIDGRRVYAELNLASEPDDFPNNPHFNSGVVLAQVDEDGVGAEWYVDIIMDAAECTELKTDPFPFNWDGSIADECDEDATAIIVSNIQDVDELDEDDACPDDGTNDDDNSSGDAAGLGCVAGPDDGGFDAYFLVWNSVCDRLDNCLEDGGPPGRNGIAQQFRGSGAFGIDMTEPTTLDAAGATTFQPSDQVNPFTWNPDSDDNGTLDETFMFEAVDPLLASGDPGTGVNNINTPTGVGDQDLDTQDLDVEFDQAGPGGITLMDCNETDGTGFANTSAGSGMFECDMDTGGFPDDTYAVTTQISDRALRDRNVHTVTQTIIIDTTDPVFGALNPPPTGSPGTDASAIVMTIGGTVNDISVLTADINVYVDGTDAAGTGFDGTCDAATDYLLDDTAPANEIDRNDVNISDGTNAIAFTDTFTIAEPAGAVNPVGYCFIIDATDAAKSKDGTAQGNNDSLATLVFVTWNP